MSNKIYTLGNHLTVESAFVLDLTLLSALEQAKLLLQGKLQRFASDATFGDKMEVAFGAGVNPGDLQGTWQAGDVSGFPPIEIVSGSELNGAKGAYALATNRIYLSQEFLSQNRGNLEALTALLLEEYGHSVDGVLNSTDAPGDEGAIFSALVQGESLSDAELAQLKAEDDRGVIHLNGNVIAVEMQNFTGGSENNNFVGTSGNDNFYPGTGADSIIGGAGADFLAIDNRNDTANTTITYTNVNNGSITGGSNNGTVFQGVEFVNLRTGAGNDQINLIATTTVSGFFISPAEVYAGAGDDTVIGNDTGGNYLYGQDGNDSLQGGSERDDISGGNGNDILLGFGGNDNLFGEVGNDTLNGGDGNDNLTPGIGADSIIGGTGTDFLDINNSNDTAFTRVTYTTPNNGSIAGGSNSGTTFREIEQIHLRTGAGNDQIDLSATVDSISRPAVDVYTGAGNDTVIGSATGYNVIWGQDGNDSLRGGSGRDDFSGGNGNDILEALGGNDNLFGEVGNDTLNGGDGNDNLTPGIGADSIIGGTGTDFLDINNSNDTAFTRVTYTTPNNGSIAGGSNSGTTFREIEQIHLRTGAGNDQIDLSATVDSIFRPAVDVYAGAGNDMVVGSATGYNVIQGQDGNDSLQGGSARDDFYGGNGNDILLGFGGNDNLFGEVGNDTLAPGLGNDFVDGGIGTDVLVLDYSSVTTSSLGYSNPINEPQIFAGTNSVRYFNIEVFNITATALNDRVQGGNGNDTLIGSVGNDTLIGGLGNDVYGIDSANDVITENANEGVDTVQSTVNYTLGNTLENLTLLNTTNLSGTGNAVANNITGNSGSNTLRGLDGNDTLNGGMGTDNLIGGTGNDTYIIDNVGDMITENVNEGTDTVRSLLTYSLTNSNLENLTLLGGANIHAAGNAGNNILTGNTANNILTGLGGNDTLIGGAGDDIYVIDASDTITENVNSGIDTVQVFFNYVLSNANLENITLVVNTDINATGNSAANRLVGNSGKNILTECH